MLIAISGSQGSGKSTILNKLETMGYNTIKRKSARSILDEWGVTLNDVNGNHDLTIKFQNEITSRKRDDEKNAIKDSKIWFTERTHADLFTYALIDLGRNNLYSSWIDNYYETCLLLNQDYTLVYYLESDKFQVEHDDVRGSNIHYSKMVNATMLEFTRQMIHPSKLSVLNISNLYQRVSIIDAQTKILKEKYKHYELD